MCTLNSIQGHPNWFEGSLGFCIESDGYLVRNFGANGTIFDFGKCVLFKPSSIIFTDRDTIFYLCETKIGQIEKCAWQGYLKVVPPFHAPSFLTTLHLRVRLTLPSCPFLQLDFIIWTFWFTILSLVVCYNNNFYVKKKLLLITNLFSMAH